MSAIDATGYTIPTPIQAQAIPVALQGRDVLGIAQTGTGKTASFVLPLLARLEKGRARARMPRSLILAPTRELAAQVAEAFETYGTNHKFTMALLIGGVSFDEQLRKLDRGVDVLIATPGRLLDHFGRGKLLLTGVQVLVIDEADRMLDMGFIPDIEKICKLLPPRRQTLFFSATMPGEITRLAGQFLQDPERVEVAPPATTAKTITQRFRYTDDGDDRSKREILRELIDGHDVQNAIIFANRKRDVAILLKSLLKHGYNAGALHGDMDQTARMATLEAFRTGKITILAASDVAARGLDIPAVSHVFNYDMPWQSDDYVHRIGRTGRAGRQGAADSIVTGDDLKVVRTLEKLAGGESVTWIGEPPDEDADAPRNRRRRGRGGAAASGSEKAKTSRSERGSRTRGGRGRFKGASDAEEAAKTADVAGTSAKPDAAPDDEVRNASAEGDAPKPRRSRGGRKRRTADDRPDVETHASDADTDARGDDDAPATKPRRRRKAEGESATARNDDAGADRREPVGASKERSREPAVAPLARRPRPSRASRAADAAPERVPDKAPERGLGDNIPDFLRRPVRMPSDG
ncbi:MAG: DEAD/DEAH box helicase [Pseudomonadota bacterium]